MAMWINDKEIKLTEQQLLDEAIVKVMKYIKEKKPTGHEKGYLQSTFHIKNKLAHLASHIANPKTKAEKQYSDIILGALMSTFRGSIEFMYHKSQISMKDFTEEDSLIWLLPHIRGNILGPSAIKVGLEELLKLQEVPESSDSRITAMIWPAKIDYNKIRKAINDEFGFDK